MLITYEIKVDGRVMRTERDPYNARVFADWMQKRHPGARVEVEQHPREKAMA